MGVRVNSIIVPEHIQNKLLASAQAQSQSSWEIADCALEVFNNYQMRKDRDDPLFASINEGDVWRALSHFAGKSASRVRGLAYVAQKTPRWIRQMYESRWGFGYFEKIAASPYDMGEVFSYLEEYQDGTITYPQPGRVLGVGEFLLIYETQIYGVNRDTTPPPPDMIAIDAAEIASRGVSFQGLLQHVHSLRRQLWLNRDKPSVSRLIDLTEELEGLVPKAMEELGIVLAKQEKLHIDREVQTS